MTRTRNDDDMEVFEVVVPGAKGDRENADTEATRRTKATLESMSGSAEVGDGYITVFKIEKGNEERCEKIPGDKYTYDDLCDYIKQEYGPGDYRMRLYVRGESNRFQLAENRMETLRGASKPSTAAPAIPAGTDPAVVALLQGQQAQFDKMIAKLDQGTPKQMSMAEILTAVGGFVAAVSPIVVPLMTRRQENPMAQLRDLLTITKDAKALQAGEAPAAEAAGGATAMDLVQTGLQTLGAMLQTRQLNALPPGTQPAPHATAPAPMALAAPQGTPPIPPSNLPDVSLFVAQADAIMAACLADPTVEGAEKAAQTAAAQIPEAFYPMALATLEHPFFLKAVLMHKPEFVDIIDWLMYMRDEMVDILAGEQDDGASVPAGQGDTNGDTQRDTGHSGDTGQDAGTN